MTLNYRNLVIGLKSLGILMLCSVAMAATKGVDLPIPTESNTVILIDDYQSFINQKKIQPNAVESIFSLLLKEGAIEKSVSFQILDSFGRQVDFEKVAPTISSCAVVLLNGDNGSEREWIVIGRTNDVESYRKMHEAALESLKNQFAAAMQGNSSIVKITDETQRLTGVNGPVSFQIEKLMIGEKPVFLSGNAGDLFVYAISPQSFVKVAGVLTGEFPGIESAAWFGQMDPVMESSGTLRLFLDGASERNPKTSASLLKLYDHYGHVVDFSADKISVKSVGTGISKGAISTVIKSLPPAQEMHFANVKANDCDFKLCIAGKGAADLLQIYSSLNIDRERWKSFERFNTLFRDKTKIDLQSACGEVFEKEFLYLRKSNGNLRGDSNVYGAFVRDSVKFKELAKNIQALLVDALKRKDRRNLRKPESVVQKKNYGSSVVWSVPAVSGFGEHIASAAMKENIVFLSNSPEELSEIVQDNISTVPAVKAHLCVETKGDILPEKFEGNSAFLNLMRVYKRIQLIAKFDGDNAIFDSIFFVR